MANSIKADSGDIIPMINDKGNFYYLSTFENKLNEVGNPTLEEVDTNFIKKFIKDGSTIVVNSEDSFKYIINCFSATFTRPKSHFYRWRPANGLGS